jgi:hypothetical protein
MPPQTEFGNVLYFKLRKGSKNGFGIKKTVDFNTLKIKSPL